MTLGGGRATNVVRPPFSLEYEDRSEDEVYDLDRGLKECYELTSIQYQDTLISEWMLLRRHSCVHNTDKPVTTEHLEGHPPMDINTLALGAAQWDIKSFFDNAATYVKGAGGSLLILMGVVAIVWGGVKLVKKLMGGQNAQQESWFMIAALIIVGGALATGGWTLMSTIASGGQTTITQLGGGGLIFLGF